MGSIFNRKDKEQAKAKTKSKLCKKIQKGDKQISDLEKDVASLGTKYETRAKMFTQCSSGASLGTKYETQAKMFTQRSRGASLGTKYETQAKMFTQRSRGASLGTKYETRAKMFTQRSRGGEEPGHERYTDTLEYREWALEKERKEEQLEKEQKKLLQYFTAFSSCCTGCQDILIRVKKLQEYKNDANFKRAPLKFRIRQDASSTSEGVQQSEDNSDKFALRGLCDNATSGAGFVRGGETRVGSSNLAQKVHLKSHVIPAVHTSNNGALTILGENVPTYDERTNCVSLDRKPDVTYRREGYNVTETYKRNQVAEKEIVSSRADANGNLYTHIDYSTESEIAISTCSEYEPTDIEDDTASYNCRLNSTGNILRQNTSCTTDILGTASTGHAMENDVSHIDQLHQRMQKVILKHSSFGNKLFSVDRTQSNHNEQREEETVTNGSCRSTWPREKEPCNKRQSLRKDATIETGYEFYCILTSDDEVGRPETCAVKEGVSKYNDVSTNNKQSKKKKNKSFLKKLLRKHQSNEDLRKECETLSDDNSALTAVTVKYKGKNESTKYSLKAEKAELETKLKEVNAEIDRQQGEESPFCESILMAQKPQARQSELAICRPPRQYFMEKIRLMGLMFKLPRIFDKLCGKGIKKIATCMYAINAMSPERYAAIKHDTVNIDAKRCQLALCIEEMEAAGKEEKVKTAFCVAGFGGLVDNEFEC